jgi:hypothetical protein
MSSPLRKYLRFSDEGIESELYLDQNSKEELVEDEEAPVWDICFSDSEDSDSEQHSHNGTWRTGCSSKQVPAFTGPNVKLDHNAAPNIKDDSSPLGYFELLFTENVITLLVEESNVYCHQYYSQLAPSSSLSQDITCEEMKVSVALILRMGHDQKPTLKSCSS